MAEIIFIPFILIGVASAVYKYKQKREGQIATRFLDNGIYELSDFKRSVTICLR